MVRIRFSESASAADAQPEPPGKRVKVDGRYGVCTCTAVRPLNDEGLCSQCEAAEPVT